MATLVVQHSTYCIYDMSSEECQYLHQMCAQAWHLSIKDYGGFVGSTNAPGKKYSEKEPSCRKKVHIFTHFPIILMG